MITYYNALDFLMAAIFFCICLESEAKAGIAPFLPLKGGGGEEGFQEAISKSQMDPIFYAS